ncbi:MAG: hypothetical protein ACHQSE_14915, partial [Gemmatimonadales bacterium]
AQLIAVRKSERVIRTYAFSPDSTQITTELSLLVNDTATYTVTINLLAAGTVMFTGTVQAFVTAGQIGLPLPVALQYAGPGQNIDSVRIAPRDSFVTPGGQLLFRITAYDSSGSAVGQFYAHWATSSAGDVINGAGLFRAGQTTGTLWVYATTPSGVRDSTRVTVGSAAGPVIALSVPGEFVGIGASQQTQAVVTLSPAAPAGGVTVTLVSDSTQYVTVAAPATIFIPAGATVGSSGLVGVAPGVSILHATAPGYAAGAAAAAATPNFVTVAFDTVAVGGTKAVGVTLSTPAPVGGLPVLLISEDTTAFRFINGAVTNPLVGTMQDTIPAGSSSLNVTVTGLNAGIVPIVAAASNYAVGIDVLTVIPSTASLALVSGGAQTGAVNTPLAQPITVRVPTPAGAPLSGYLVTFTVASGGGSVATLAAVTDASGNASTNWTLGAVHGTQTLSVTVTGAAGSPLTVTATAP